MKKILVIEDNLEVRENLAEILELSNYIVDIAVNGKEGVQKALSNPPDLILCDVMMPNLDGYGVVKILDSKPITSDIPFVFLTAKAEKSDMRKGMNLGADDYITKPFDDVELLDAIEMRLKKSERLKKSFDGTASGLHSFLNEAVNENVLKDILDKMESKKYRKKDLIYEEGRMPKNLYFISTGKVKSYKVNDFGKELITGMYESGDFIGYQDLILNSEYEENASTIEETEIIEIPKSKFFSLLYNNRDFAARFIKILTGNVKSKEERLLSLAYNSIRERVAEALIKMHTLNKGENFSILRDDLASMVGTAKESVIRTLADFKNEKLIEIDKGMIHILDIKKLNSISG